MTGPDAVILYVIRLIQMNRIAQWDVYASKRGDARRAVCVALHCPERDPKSEHGDYRTYAEVQAHYGCQLDAVVGVGDAIPSPPN